MQASQLTTLLKQLVAIPSLTPEDNGCQAIIADYLDQLGFACQRIDHPPVSNLWAQIGEQGPLLVFAGHTDVVDIGECNAWHTPPFEPTIKGNILYGRGACDMKGSLAAMLLAAKELISQQPNFKGSLGFLITSGEEGDQFDLGTPKVMEWLASRGKSIDYCIVGEPSSSTTVGDVIKIGRRGSLTGDVTVYGKQGHVAYPALANNPIHGVANALAALSQQPYDNGNEYFPPTSFQICHIQSGSGAGNIIPGQLRFKFNFRYSSETDAATLQHQVEQLLDSHLSLSFDINWRLNGEPFLTSSGQLLKATQTAIETHCGCKPTLSTAGGTSDGRFIAPYGVEVIELGPVNATIHQVNEEVDLNQLVTLAECYYDIAKKLLT